MTQRPSPPRSMRRARAPRFTGALTLMMLTTLTAWAQEGDMMPAQPAPLTLSPEYSPGVGPAGMGQAQNALSSGPSGLFHNPAGLARAYMYALEGAFMYTPTGNVLSAAVVDSKTNPRVAAGVGLNYYFSRAEDQDLRGLDLRFPIAVPIVPDRVSIGIGGRYMNFKQDEIEVMKGFSLEAGALFKVVDQLTVGVIAKNLLDPCKSVACEGWVPLTVGGGVAYGTYEFSVAGDIEFNLSAPSGAPFNLEAGGEYLVAQAVPVRLGYRRIGETAAHMATAGTGWRSKSAGIDMAYQHDFSQARFGNFLLGVSAYF